MYGMVVLMLIMVLQRYAATFKMYASKDNGLPFLMLYRCDGCSSWFRCEFTSEAEIHIFWIDAGLWHPGSCMF